MKKLEIGQDAKVLVRWNTSQQLTTKEEEKNIISAMAKKYGIPSKNIRVEKHFIDPSLEDNVLAGEIVHNVNDPKFMQELMKQYIAAKGITDVDFDDIVKIDSAINACIDFSVYDKGKKYTIKWVKWGNFLSYGPDNYFDFTKLHGLILLNGQPANKSGKSTFAYDLLHFLLFGKTNTNKAKTLGDLFNNYLPDERVMNVEGCINIDGDDYIIRRTLTRGAAGKKTRTVTNKVEYFRVAKDGSEEILPDENEQGASTTKTTKIIKEALGNESDFDLIISANAKDLDSLISLTETEKGRLLSRWIGLSIIEDKDVKAREKWNKEISVGRYCDMYNRTQLENEVEALNTENTAHAEQKKSNETAIAEAEKNIEEYGNTRDILLSSKQSIDPSLTKVDVETLKTAIAKLVESGKAKNAEIQFIEGQIKEIGDVDYSEDEYKAMKKENDALISSMSEARANIKHIKETNDNLSSSEYCPVCHKKFDNVDNSKLIEENKKKIEKLIEDGIKMKKRSDFLTEKMESIADNRSKYLKKSQLELKIATIKSDVASQRLEYTEKNNLLKDIKKNEEAIKKNNEIDTKLNVVNENIRINEGIKRAKEQDNKDIDRYIAKNTEMISARKSYITKIEEELKTEKNWKLYLQMIGKDGISKMVLRNTLPIINNELNRLLGDVADFSVEITMNEKNDIDFLLHRDGIITRLSAASGLERTQAALALRVVLGKMSRLSRPPFILLDEVLGTVAKENYDDMKKLYDKIVSEYDFVLHICHIDLDWYDEGNVVTVVKKDNISSISI